MAGGRHGPPPPASSSGAAFDHIASVASLHVDDAWDDFMQRLHPLESFREAVWAQCGESWTKIASIFDPSGRGVVTSSAFVAGVGQLRIPESSLAGCADAAEVFDRFLDPSGAGEVVLWCLAKECNSSRTGSDTESDTGSRCSPSMLQQSLSSFSDRGKRPLSASTTSGSSLSRVRSPRAEFRWVEHRIATVNTDIEGQTKLLEKLTSQQQSQPSKHAAETARAVSLMRSRSEQVMSKHRARLEALQEEAAEAVANNLRLSESAKVAHQRIQAACKLKLSTETLIDSTERQIPAIMTAHAAAVLAEREATSAEKVASEAYSEVYGTFDLSRRCVQALMEERDRLEVQSSEHARRAQAMVDAREEARQCLIDEDICLRSEMSEDREQFAVAVSRMEGMMDHLESSAGPRIAEVATLHFEETKLRQEWQAEEAFAKENFESVLKRGKSSIAALRQRLKEEQLVATRRGQDAMDSGVSAVSAAEAEGTESIRRSEALSARVQLEGRRLRSDLNKTARFLGGHQAQNVRLEEVAAAAHSELDALTRQSSEIQEDIAEMRELREVMTIELQDEQQRAAGIRLSHEERAASDWRELAELRAESKVLTGNLLEERETLSKITERWQAMQVVENSLHILGETREKAKFSSERFVSAEQALENEFMAELSEQEMQARVKREELLEAFTKVRPVERPVEDSREAGAIEEAPPWFDQAMRRLSR